MKNVPRGKLNSVKITKQRLQLFSRQNYLCHMTTAANYKAFMNIFRTEKIVSVFPSKLVLCLNRMTYSWHPWDVIAKSFLYCHFLKCSTSIFVDINFFKKINLNYFVQLQGSLHLW